MPLSDSKKLHLKDQRGLRWNHGGMAAFSVCKLVRDRKESLLSQCHSGNTLVPPLKDLTSPKGELEGLPTVA